MKRTRALLEVWFTVRWLPEACAWNAGPIACCFLIADSATPSATKFRNVFLSWTLHSAAARASIAKLVRNKREVHVFDVVLLDSKEALVTHKYTAAEVEQLSTPASLLTVVHLSSLFPASSANAYTPTLQEEKDNMCVLLMRGHKGTFICNPYKDNPPCPWPDLSFRGSPESWTVQEFHNVNNVVFTLRHAGKELEHRWQWLLSDPVSFPWLRAHRVFVSPPTVSKAPKLADNSAEFLLSIDCEPVRGDLMKRALQPLQRKSWHAFIPWDAGAHPSSVRSDGKRTWVVDGWVYTWSVGLLLRVSRDMGKESTYFC